MAVTTLNGETQMVFSCSSTTTEVRPHTLKDMRNELVTLSQSQYSVSISDITFKDGGVYKCLHYSNDVVTKRYKVIVLSGPILEKTEHEDKTIIKCSASENGQAPRLSWLLDNGLEIEAHPNYVLENASNKYTAVSLLHVKTHKKRTTVKCLAQYSAVRGAPLIDFIHIGNQGEEPSPTSESISTTTQKVITPTLVPWFSSTEYTSDQSETTEEPKTNVSTTSSNSTKVNETTESISETTEGSPVNTSAVSTTETDSFNNTSGVGSEDEGISERKQKEKGNSVLLVLLVTCLIFCLVVVIAFFLVRLRKAHLAWKQENEEFDQSVESSKSKSSNEEKQKQNQPQRVQGFWNTSFTKYKVEEAAAERDTNTTQVTVEVPDERPHHPNPTVLKSCIRETEL
ncbi:cytotoxic and regulatory T-cell molecule isoform X2 [Salminus brasiliensis]|uniref:cytotoxic and regulatory T-cell molecule isoform X2 n=1 Tax=Salminus brasiliensis TaxID=930266 RepID=UPI003B832B81